MSWLNLGSFGGLIALAFLAWAAGGFRRPVPWRTVRTAGGLMLILGAVVFWLPWTRIGPDMGQRHRHHRSQGRKRGRAFPVRPASAEPGRDRPGRRALCGFHIGSTGVAGGGLFRVAHGGALPPPHPATHREAVRRPVPQDHGPLRSRVPGRFVQHLHRRGVGHDRPPLRRPHDALRAAHADHMRHGDGGVHDAGALRPVPQGQLPAHRGTPGVRLHHVHSGGGAGVQADTARNRGPGDPRRRAAHGRKRTKAEHHGRLDGRLLGDSSWPRVSLPCSSPSWGSWRSSTTP